MAKKVADIRNIAVCGHGSSGKTTLVDQFLMKSGAVKGLHSVDDGSSICDFDEEEKHHKHSIEASVTHFEHAGKHFNVIDTPGYPDLIGQTIGALRAADTALIVIDAAAGIKVNSRRVWSEAGKAGIGRILCITRLDGENINFEALVDSIKEIFGNQCALFNVPIGHGHDFKGVVSTLEPSSDTAGALIDPATVSESVIESIIEADEAVMEKYFEGEMPSKEQLAKLTIEAIKQGTITPILCVSAKKDIGVAELLDLLASSALPPSEVSRTAKKEGDEVTLKPEPSAPLAAQVFKTRIDPFVQKLSYIRVYSGTLKKDLNVNASGARKGVKIGPLLAVQADKTEPVDEAGPGEIVAIAKSEDLHTGTTIGDVELPPIQFPTPMAGLAIVPRSHGDDAKLSGALHKLTEEDKTLHLDHDPETKEMVLTGMSELHLQLVRERLKRRDKVEVDAKEPKIPYRETIQSNADGSYRHKKQSGGSGQFAEVHIRMYPFPRGTKPEEFATKDRFPHLKHTNYHEKNNFLFVDTVVGGTIPGNFLPAIEKGFLERLQKGVIAGYTIQNVCAEVHFGKDHPVDSNETAFRIAGARAFFDTFKKARPSLLEPVVMLHITVPADRVGDVSSDLSGRRGQLVGMDSAGGGLTTIEAKAPLSEVTTYARTLSSMTGGQGSFTMEFSHYDVVPPNVQQEIIAKAQVKEDVE